jgi:MurNAc alpha-1-phosphate uridylyltransferase
MNTDAIWNGPNPLGLLLDAWDPSRMDALLMGIPPENALEHDGAGDFKIDAEGRLSRGAGVVYGGVQIIKTDLLAGIPESAFSLNLVWDKMLEKGTMYGIPYSGQWCDVGHPSGIKTAEGLVATDV